MQDPCSPFHAHSPFPVGAPLERVSQKLVVLQGVLPEEQDIRDACTSLTIPLVGGLYLTLQFSSKDFLLRQVHHSECTKKEPATVGIPLHYRE